MAGVCKRKLNLTIDENVLERAKRVVSSRDESLSALVEEFLSRLALESSEESLGADDWIEEFHEKYLPTNYRELDDETIEASRVPLLKKYA